MFRAKVNTTCSGLAPGEVLRSAERLAVPCICWSLPNGNHTTITRPILRAGVVSLYMLDPQRHDIPSVIMACDPRQLFSLPTSDLLTPGSQSMLDLVGPLWKVETW